MGMDLLVQHGALHSGKAQLSLILCWGESGQMRSRRCRQCVSVSSASQMIVLRSEVFLVPSYLHLTSVSNVHSIVPADLPHN
nr:hypothetical protein CFP56_58745 [Quercus suber]